ncbi:MAG: hypothetical protein HC828_08980 [Blastochloris sp.]|nr:hypothetical protein [Blastochloris sp.]
MATLALFALGSAIGPSLFGSAVVGGLTGAALGGAIGATAGSLIDSQFLFPALFGNGTQNYSGPRLDDFRVQLASEGSPVNYCMGPHNRVSGTVIWSTDLIESSRTQRAGKGGGSSSSTSYSYSVSCAVGVCEGPISAIKKIWADTKVIVGDPDPTVVGASTITVTKKGDQMRIKSPSGSPSLRAFKSNLNATVTGFANAANNGTFLVVRTRTTGSNNTYVYLKNADAVTESTAPAYVSISQDIPIEAGRYAESITVYNGTDSQSPSSVIQGYEGAENTPAFRGTAYVVFQNLKLADFGNRIPQFTFLVEADEGLSVQSAIRSFRLSRSGLTSDVLRCNSSYECLSGYTIAGPTQMADALIPLINSYGVRVQESQGKLKFFHFGAEPITAVSDTLFGAGSSSPDRAKLTISDSTSFDIPTEVDVQYFDIDRDHQKGSQRERRNNEFTRVVRSIDVPVVLNATQARNIAIRTLWTGWSERQLIEMSLPPRFTTIRENEALTFSYNGSDYKVRVLSVDRGNNHLIKVRGVTQEDHIFQELDIVPSGGATSDELLYIPPLLELMVFDMAALRTEDTIVAGFYYAVAIADDSSSFTGASLYEQLPGSSRYDELERIEAEGTTMGVCESVLGDGSYGYWDRNSTVDVELFDGELSSEEEIDVLNGSNTALIGTEVVAFTTATLIDTRTYRLSGLIRGLRNTQSSIATHVADERFLLLNTAVKFHQVDLAARDSTRNYKAISVGSEIDETDEQSLTLAMTTFRAWSVVHVKATRSSGDLAITWIRRTRGFVRQYSGSSAPLLTSNESYEIDIMDGSTVVRTISSSTPSATYTSADQTTDFGSPQSSIVTRIYELTTEYGRGDVAEQTL